MRSMCSTASIVETTPKMLLFSMLQGKAAEYHRSTGGGLLHRNTTMKTSLAFERDPAMHPVSILLKQCTEGIHSARRQAKP